AGFPCCWSLTYGAHRVRLFFQAEDGIRDFHVTGVQTCALPIWARKLRVGPGDDPASEMGPLITREHRDKVASYVAGAAAQGAEVVVDGTELTVEGHEDGFFLGVSLLDRVPVTADAYRDEIFGPVLCVVRAET